MAGKAGRSGRRRAAIRADRRLSIRLSMPEQERLTLALRSKAAPAFHHLVDEALSREADSDGRIGLSGQSLLLGQLAVQLRGARVNLGQMLDRLSGPVPLPLHALGTFPIEDLHGVKARIEEVEGRALVLERARRRFVRAKREIVYRCWLPAEVDARLRNRARLESAPVSRQLRRLLEPVIIPADLRTGQSRWRRLAEMQPLFEELCDALNLAAREMNRYALSLENGSGRGRSGRIPPVLEPAALRRLCAEISAYAAEYSGRLGSGPGKADPSPVKR